MPDSINSEQLALQIELGIWVALMDGLKNPKLESVNNEAFNQLLTSQAAEYTQMAQQLDVREPDTARVFNQAAEYITMQQDSYFTKFDLTKDGIITTDDYDKLQSENPELAGQVGHFLSLSPTQQVSTDTEVTDSSGNRDLQVNTDPNETNPTTETSNPPPPQPEVAQTHTIKAGDTYWSIAQRLVAEEGGTGSVRERAIELIALNGGKDPRSLRIGDTLITSGQPTAAQITIANQIYALSDTRSSGYQTQLAALQAELQNPQDTAQTVTPEVTPVTNDGQPPEGLDPNANTA